MSFNKYYDKNREKLKAYQREYYRINKEKRKKCNHDYYIRHRGLNTKLPEDKIAELKKKAYALWIKTFAR